MKEAIRTIKYLIIFFVVGLGVPYLVQFQLNFFGATFVTFGEIVRIWILTPLITFCGLFLIYARKGL